MAAMSTSTPTKHGGRWKGERVEITTRVRPELAGKARSDAAAAGLTVNDWIGHLLEHGRPEKVRRTG